ncbi:MAG: hypothetical protein JXB30_18535 [Anaerolineae bacterium]|nr:hypothetical protein [Anaerolineae bacterium]
MSELVVFVLDDPQKCDQVINAWLSQGVTGVTILNSMGLANLADCDIHPMRDDLPLFPGLGSLMRSREECHRTLMAVIPDGFDIEALVAATEAIIGVLDEPETGILFVIPIGRVWGLRHKQD